MALLNRSYTCCQRTILRVGVDDNTSENRHTTVVEDVSNGEGTDIVNIGEDVGIDNDGLRSS